jgi:NADPH2:quinone reductase
MQAVRIYKTGGSDVLTVDEIDSISPGPGQVRITQKYIGLNFIDVYMRTGIYPVDSLPATLGMEAMGIVEETGDGVHDLRPGDRVAYAMVPGAYASERIIDADKLVPVPDSVEDRTAAAIMLKGLTAYYLLHRTYPVKSGETILVYAAAGGVGSLLTQWAKHIGACVIGCVGNEQKAEIARGNGCDHVILYHNESIPDRIREITDDAGVRVVYDGIGQSTFMDSLDSLGKFGMMVSFGNITGKIEPFSPAILASKGSLYLTRPTLATHVSTRELLLDGAEKLFDAIDKKIISPDIQGTWPLAEAAAAHNALESGKTTGLSVLSVD